MLPFRLVYSDKYLLPIGAHVFPADKYLRTRDRLISLGVAEASDFVEPVMASDADVLLVHTPFYVNKLKRGILSTREELELEIPFSHGLAERFWLMAGGSTVAADFALRDMVCVHVGGGFHHAFPDHGEGFCMVHDVAVAIRRMQRDGRIVRAMIVDCDVHQGNGSAAIFGEGEPEPFPKPMWISGQRRASRPANMKTSAARDVFTVSLHQENNYPLWKPPSSIDINLPDGTTDGQYMEWLRVALDSAIQRFPEPELICYIAGADPYIHDQLGGLALTIEGLKQRDCQVLTFARELGVPVMVTYAGGYARNIEDTVTIHANTVVAAKEVFGNR